MSCDSDDLAVRSADLSYLLIEICFFFLFYILNILPWNGWDRCLYHIFPQQSRNSLISISGSHKPPSQHDEDFISIFISSITEHDLICWIWRIYFWPDGKRFWKSCSPQRRNMSTTCSLFSRVTGDFFTGSSFLDSCVLPQGPYGILALASRSKVSDHLRQPWGHLPISLTVLAARTRAVRFAQLSTMICILLSSSSLSFNHVGVGRTQWT